MWNLYDPRQTDPAYQILVPSFVKIAQLLRDYQYTVGYVHRASSRYMDIHCYPDDEASYDEYWSAAEQSITEAETSDDAHHDADGESN